LIFTLGRGNTKKSYSSKMVEFFSVSLKLSLINFWPPSRPADQVVLLYSPRKRIEKIITTKTKHGLIQTPKCAFCNLINLSWNAANFVRKW
jgi:hypothetical protein